jgi:Arc/MetJ-type ribon-helix-helix transcriptional regulator
MTTISVPIPGFLEEYIKDQIKSGNASNKADVVRKALIRMREEEAINDVLEAMKEPTLRGDLRELVKKFKNA